MLTLLLVVAVAVPPEEDPTEAPTVAKGRLVLECAEPLALSVDGKPKGRCGPAAGLRNIWLPLGAHELEWRNKEGAGGKRSVSIEKGRSLQLQLPGSTAGAALDESSAPAEGGEVAEPTSIAPVAGEPDLARESSATSSPSAAHETEQPDPPGPSSSRFVKHGDGTVTDRNTGLMWAEADSYALLRRCVTPYQAKTYVEFLRAGGHANWRLPTLGELKSLLETRAKVLGHDGAMRLRLPEVFTEGASRWAWSSQSEIRPSGPNGVSERQGLTVDFGDGVVDARPAGACIGVGVRAVRLAERASR